MPLSLLAVENLYSQQVRVSALLVQPPLSEAISSQIHWPVLTGVSGDPEVITTSEIQIIQQDLVKQLANLGYPYVEIRLDSIDWADSCLLARMLVNPGMAVTIDSLVVQPANLIRKALVSRVSGLEIGQPFSHDQLRQADKRLRYYGLSDQNRPLEAGFFDSLAWVYLFPVKPKGNRFDGMVGFLPGSTGDFPRLTGALNLRLNNLSGYLEEFSLNWKSTGNQTQRLNTRVSIPYLMGSRLGSSAALSLYRKDTSFLLLDAAVSGRFTVQPGRSIETFYQYRQSRRISFSNRVDNEDYTLILTGIRWSFDQSVLPSSYDTGWRLMQSVAVGKKRPETDVQTDSSFYYELESMITYLLQTGKQSYVHFGLNTGYRSDATAENDLFRLGGANTVRGFQEENFLSNAYQTATLELRYRFAPESDFHGFLDGGWIQNYGWVYAPGLGLNLETRAGIIQLDYALGQIAGQGFSLKNGLIHLGLQSNF